MLQLLLNLHPHCACDCVCVPLCVCLLSLGICLQNEFYFNLCADRGNMTRPDQATPARPDGRGGLGHFSPAFTYRLIDTHSRTHAHITSNTRNCLKTETEICAIFQQDNVCQHGKSPEKKATRIV